MKKNKKETYEKPGIVYEKKIEVLSAVCNSARNAQQICMKAAPCVRLNA